MPGNTNSGSDESRTIQSKRGIWRTYDGTDGLPPRASCLLQDRQGYLWLGTMVRLCRYDGVMFITYTTEDGLPANSVMSICEDSQGYLWFGTNGGVSCYDGESFITYTTEDGLAGNRVISICEDSQGCLWFGTSGGGVSCYDGEGFTNYTTKDGLVTNLVSSVYEDSQGRMWFGHGAKLTGAPGIWSGVSRFDGEQFVNYTTEDGLAHNRVTAICEDSQGCLWFGTFGESGVSCYDGERFINYTTEDGLAHNDVLTIYKDRQRRLWFGTWGGGVCCFNGRSFTTYTTADGLLDNRVCDMLQDREGSFWFIHSHSGMTYFDAETTRLLTGATVSETLIQTSEGALWFGDANQLCCLYKGEQRCQTFDSGVNSLMEDSSKRLWVGTHRDGLCCYDSTDAVWEGESKHFTTEDGLNSGTIRSVIEARDGTIWIGTEGSPGCLCRFGRSRFETIQTPHPAVQRLLEDSLERIWMGGYGGGGLSYYTPLGSPSARKEKNLEGEGHAAPLHNYTMKHGLPNDLVISIVEDNAGRLWIGTFDGLCCFDGNQFIPYGEEIPEHCQYQFSAKDVNGQLWFGTLGNGVYRYNGRHFQQLSKADGLPSNSVTALVPQQDGSMIIGTYKGIVHYRPMATVPPRIEIREVVADQMHSHPEALELTTTGGNLVTIAYHGLSLSTHQMRYSYILEGYDKEWRDTWESQVRYEKLPQGEYTFRVIAINRDLVCSEAPATLWLTVVPDPRDEHIAQLEGELAERERAEMERMHQELEDARQIQQSLLPEKPPEIEGFEIAGVSHPAKEVSGDFYSYLSLGENKGIVLADVTGKSVKAAMVAALTNGTLNAEIRDRADVWNSPGSILRQLNIDLQPHLIRGMYTAMSLGIIQPEKKKLIFSNAGMPYPVVKHGREVWELEVNGMPLGLVEKAEYEDLSVDLEEGDTVIFCSDGVIEAMNEADEMYQTERLLKMVREADVGISAQDMVDLIMSDVAEFVGDVESSDDITAVVIRCKE